jgi:hypothetical protein
MSKAIFVLLGGLAATAAIAQTPHPDAPAGARAVYGTNMRTLEGKFAMDVGTGKAGECGTKLWYHEPKLIVKKEPAGTCLVPGAGQPVPQYKITFIEDTPEERAEVK